MQKTKTSLISSALGNLLLILIFCSPATATAAPVDHVPETATRRDKIIAAIPSDLSPTYFRDKKTGKASGFAVDIFNEVARKAGFTVEYIYGKPWDELIEFVRTGRADVDSEFDHSSREDGPCGVYRSD